MEIYPIQITQVDWQTYIKVCQDNLGYSPTRGLDNEGIDIKRPSAFLYTLDLNNQPRQAVQRSELYGHIFVSFAGVTDSNTCCGISKISKIAVTSIELRGEREFAIYSGTLADWHYLIVNHCNSTLGNDIREFINIIKRHLERAGFNELWSRYEEIPRADGTFVLRYKG